MNEGLLDCDTIFCNSSVPFAVILAAVMVPVNVGLALITTLPVPVIAFDTNPSLALVKTAWFAVKFDAVTVPVTSSAPVTASLPPINAFVPVCSTDPLRMFVAFTLVGAIVWFAIDATVCADDETTPASCDCMVELIAYELVKLAKLSIRVVCPASTVANDELNVE